MEFTAVFQNRVCHICSDHILLFKTQHVYYYLKGQKEVLSNSLVCTVNKKCYLVNRTGHYSFTQLFRKKLHSFKLTNLDPLHNSSVLHKEFGYLTSTLLTVKTFMALRTTFASQQVARASNQHSQLLP